MKLIDKKELDNFRIRFKRYRWLSSKEKDFVIKTALILRINFFELRAADNKDITDSFNKNDVYREVSEILECNSNEDLSIVLDAIFKELKLTKMGLKNKLYA